MRTVQLFHTLQNDKQSLGTISMPDLGFNCKTLELPWKNNEPQVSCIPDNIYLCKWTRSNRLSKLAGHDVYTYEIMNVPGRSGIRIHSANYFFQLLGCIALGDALKDINMDQQLDVIHSGKTVARFAEAMDYKDFYLDIRKAA
jgi:hypothetical protein